MKNVVSVIVPVYNCKDSIERCIQSILEQTYQNLEIVLVDDGSTDKSGIICDEMAESDWRVQVVHKSNGGVSSARNCGIEKSTGKYIMFVDSDDYLGNTYIEKMVDAIEKSNMDLVISGYTNVYDTYEIVHKCGEHSYICKEDFFTAFDLLYEQYYLHVVWNKIYVKEKVNHRFMEDTSLGEDCIFVFEYLKNIKNIQVIDDAGYFYYLGTIDSLTKRVRNNAFELAEKIYFNVKKNVDNHEIALQAIGHIFINDVTKVVREISNNENLTNEQKNQMLKKISVNDNFREALKKVNKIGKKQKIMLLLLEHGYIRCVKRMYQIFR